MKTKCDISELIVLFLRGLADSEQTAQLEEWLTESEHNKELFDIICREIESGNAHTANVDTKKGWRALSKLIHPQRIMWRRIGITTSAVAAVAAICLFVFKPEHSSDAPIIDWCQTLADVVLTTPDGIKHNIESGADSTSDYMNIKHDSTGVFSINNDAMRHTDYYEISVGDGPEQMIELSDGTCVWVGNDSWLRFPDRFDSAERCVEARGEVYFKVEHNENQPFVVKTNGAEVRVFGTEFLIGEINSRPSATLINGSVAFTTDSGESVRLVPGQKAEYTTHGIEVETIDTQLYTGLRDGYLVFDGVTLMQIVAKLEKCYQCDIEVDPETAQRQIITARIRRYETLRPILDKLSKVGHFTYRQEGGRVIIE